MNTNDATKRGYLANLIFNHKYLGDEPDGSPFSALEKENYSFYLPTNVINELDFVITCNKTKHKVSRSDIIYISLKEFLKTYKAEIAKLELSKIESDTIETPKNIT